MAAGALMLGTLMLGYFVVLGKNRQRVENLGRAAPPKSGIALSEGLLLSQRQRAIDRALVRDQRVLHALAFLRRRTGFTAGIRLDANACYMSLQPIHADAAEHDISYCLAPITDFQHVLRERHERDPSAVAYDAAVFVLLHETAHIFIRDMDLPVFGREEDAADEIASFLALDAHAPAVIDAGARFFELVAGDGGPSDEHVDPARRAYRVRCLAYGADARQFAAWVAEKKADAACVAIYAAQAHSWNTLLDLARDRRRVQALEPAQHGDRRATTNARS